MSPINQMKFGMRYNLVAKLFTHFSVRVLRPIGLIVIETRYPGIEVKVILRQDL